jgi:hypothetical protein
MRYVLYPRIKILLMLTFVLLSTSFSGFSFLAQQNLPGIYNPVATRLNITPVQRFEPLIQPAPDAEGKDCKSLNFEGLGNVQQIPPINGVTSPEWLSIIDEDAGGTGNFAFEPSPSTIAFWLGGATGDPGFRDLIFDQPASEVSLYYSSFFAMTLQAYDEADKLLDEKIGPPNFDQGPGGDPNGEYNRWDLLKVKSNSNKIKKVRVIGNVNQTGIDNLQVCSTAKVEAVEFTQAIQEFQLLKDLKTDLQGDGQPPVPMIAKKPMVMRVFMEKLNLSTKITAKISGAVSKTITQTLPSGCDVKDEAKRVAARLNVNCSINFYFTPPAGNWKIKLETFNSKNEKLEEHEFSLTSIKTKEIVLREVTVCDSKDVNGKWRCAPVDQLLAMTPFFKKITPTHRVRVLWGGPKLKLDSANFATIGAWWNELVKQLHNRGTEPYYYGIVHQDVGGNLGQASAIPGNGAASLAKAFDFTPPVDITDSTMAHEVGHLLGQRHTNTANPLTASPPGCSNKAADSTTQYPYQTLDNKIRSGTAANSKFEVGFDVASKTTIKPETTFEIMGYCDPQWITPYTYTSQLQTTKTLTVSALPRAETTGNFWTVNGIFTTPTTVDLDPIFTFETTAESGGGTGSDRIEVRNAGGDVLFTRNFDRIEMGSEGEEEEAVFFFTQLVPVQANAASIHVLDASNVELASATLGGTAPTVTITAPAGGETWEGLQNVSWEVTDSDSVEHHVWVEYSSDNGVTWYTMVYNATLSSLSIDFDEMPGANGTAKIRVRVTDGVNTGEAISNAFSVAAKLPTAAILNPSDGAAYKPDDLITLQGSGFDFDDGILEGAALRWSSDKDGNLGKGTDKNVSGLSEGNHILTLTATDSDGNVATDTVSIIVDGKAPRLTSLVVTNGTPATCVQILIDAKDGGSGVADVQYTLDAGETWTPLDPSSLPYIFMVPGTGFFEYTAQVTDQAGNLSAESDSFFISGSCGSGSLPLQLVTNSSFEAGTKFPDSWKKQGTLKGDKIVINTLNDTYSYTGQAALRFKGTAGEASALKQVLPGGFLVAGDTLDLSAFINQKNAKAGQVVQVKIKYNEIDPNTGKPAKVKMSIVLPAQGSDFYQQFTDNLVLTGSVNKLKIDVGYSASAGKFFIDDVTLLATLSATRQAEPPLPLPQAVQSALSGQ